MTQYDPSLGLDWLSADDGDGGHDDGSGGNRTKRAVGRMRVLQGWRGHLHKQF